MQLRIYAMYHKSKKILAFTVVCFIVQIAATLTVLVMDFDHILTFTNQPIPGFLNMCTVSSVNKSFTAIYAPLFCFEILLFVLAISAVFKAHEKDPCGCREETSQHDGDADQRNARMCDCLGIVSWSSADLPGDHEFNPYCNYNHPWKPARAWHT
ncbi:uncharacterized protein EDB91DRAFT_1242057 [Suillus paluster]|uniref:uncharacterized protein n=1 Tax=Suillus paluster TaxID=48578 RepID=UPI001B8781A6|nr:uncharacterized protein EDB91DRAFT_1242057 [Suillus paluster]KAG1754822.1 hypothetical protein EDB91DRAFT_1242057 [Suillus paluster]